MDLSLDMDKLLQLRRDYLEQVVRRQQQEQLKEVGMLEKYMFTLEISLWCESFSLMKCITGEPIDSAR